MGVGMEVSPGPGVHDMAEGVNVFSRRRFRMGAHRFPPLVGNLELDTGSEEPTAEVQILGDVLG